MNLPFRRRNDMTRSAHDRARILAAQQLDEPLLPAQADWLGRHLAECTPCRVVADGYAAQRSELRAMRDRAPQPPRDLWARTAAAIEAESARASHAAGRRRKAPLLQRARPGPVPLGALSGALVVAVVVGVSLLSGRSITPAPPSRTLPPIAQTQSPGRSLEPGATPIPVTADVGWAISGDGRLEFYSSTIDEVCAAGESPDCAPIVKADARTVELPDANVQSVILSPDAEQIVVVDTAGGRSGDKILVVPVPTPAIEPDPSGPSASPPATATPTASPSTAPPTVPPTVTIAPSLTPSSAPTDHPSVPPSPPPSVEPTGSGEPVDTSAPIEIASDVILVGEAASYSPDGAWFAFSARPADGSHGPDVYVWQVGQASAVPITDDHRSVVSSWMDGRILASRAVSDAVATPDPSGDPSAQPTTEPSFDQDARFRPETFLIDPATTEETILEGIPAWRPSVDPTRRLAVYWDGTLQLDEATFEWQPAEGRLVLGRWPVMPAPPVDPNASAPPDGSAAPPSTEPTPPIDSPEASPAVRLEEPIEVIHEERINDWDARWDELGTHLAVWLEDKHNPAMGTLSLRILDPDTGEPLTDKPVVSRFALPGFSIGEGRLAWATPGGENGAGSKVAVVAWSEDSIGSVETLGGDEKIVIIR